jgi:hypothetical protein
MTAKDLIELLKQFPPEREIRFAEYTSQGQTLRWRISLCCNLEHQAEINQLWFSRAEGTLPEDNYSHSEYGEPEIGSKARRANG